MVGSQVKKCAALVFALLTVQLAAAPGGMPGFAAPAREGSAMGVFVDLRTDRIADDIHALGLGWVRCMYAWTWLEPEPGKWRWTEFEQWIARAHSRNLKVLIVAQGSPAWANGGHGPEDAQTGLNTPPLPEFEPAFAAYVAGLATHGADAVEIWNEPNSGFWLPAPDAKRWARLVAASYTAVKGVRPNVSVITGGVCPVPGGPGAPDSPEHFLAAALAGVPLLAHRCDGIGHHPYVFANDPAAKDPLTAPYQWNAILQTATMHKILSGYGVGSKPFWFTEYGVPTGGPFGAVTPQESGTIYAHYYAAFDALTAEGIRLGPSFFWTLSDDRLRQQANTMEGWEGIYDVDGKPKASVEVIRVRAAAPRKTTFKK